VTLRLADTYYVAKSYQQALDLYDKVIQANAADKNYAYYQKSVTLGLLGRREEASKTLGTLLRTAPNSRYADDAVYQQAQFDFEAGDFQPAVDGFTKLIENRPNSPLIPQALQKRGVAYANLSQHEKAVTDFRQVLTQFPRTKAANSALFSLQESLTALGKTSTWPSSSSRTRKVGPPKASSSRPPSRCTWLRSTTRPFRAWNPTSSSTRALPWPPTAATSWPTPTRKPARRPKL
jgi:tetratricopeptide (TPR) repeat protein